MLEKNSEPPENYKEALFELDQLLKDLEGEGMDVDGVVEKVERGAVLLKYCQSKLRTTQLRVKEVLASLDEEPFQSENPPG